MGSNEDVSKNFGIEETLDMGVGDAQLLSDLMSPETSTANADDLKKIGEESPEDDVTKKDVNVKKEVVASEEKEENLLGEELIDKFLTTSDEEEEEEEQEEEDSSIKKEAVKEEEQTEEEEVSPEAIQFSALAKDLYKLGVFTKTDEDENEEISTPEEFLERFNAEKKRGSAEILDNFLGQFGEDYQNAFEAIFVKGVNPKDYFTEYNEITDFANIEITGEANKDNQKKVIRQGLADQGFEAEDIDSEIERLENYGDLEQVALRHQKVLVKKGAEKLKLKEENAQIMLQQKQAIKNEYIQNVKRVLQDKLKAKEFDGIPINGKFANELHDFLVVDKWKTQTGETLTDFDKAILELKKPENHETKVKIGALIKLLEKDPTLSTIQRSGITKKSNQIFEEVARQVTKKKSPDIKGSRSRSYFDGL